MTRVGAARSFAIVAVLLDALVIALLVGSFRVSVDVPGSALVHDEGLAWRTPEALLHGRLVTVVAEGDASFVGVEATLTVNGAERLESRSPHPEIREKGGGRWSLWRGQLYVSTIDGSDPRTNGRTLRLEGPLRPTPLLVFLALGATVVAVVVLRRVDPALGGALDRLADAVATRFDGQGPNPLGSLSPWLLAAAMVLVCATDRVGEWFSWDFNAKGSYFLPPYFGRADLWIAGLFVLAIVASRRMPSAAVLGSLLVVIACLVLGGVPLGAFNDWQPQWIGAIQGGRFSLAFLAAWCVVRDGGARAALPAVSLFGAIWIVGVARASWLSEERFIQVGGHFPSFAGMVLGLVAIVSLARGSIAWAVACVVGIVATGSRSAAAASALAALAMLAMRLFASRTAPAASARDAARAAPGA
ncbi:MAG: hypothetical protein FJ253_12225, partial [Phycisphaerae bacterium]|nr:hypothetical protein [Phycisphaerae bacterium]